jgi:hypothetical protein
LLWVLAALAASVSVMAGTAGGRFGVNITLDTGAAVQAAPGGCVSQTRGSLSGALVRVACENALFINLAPRGEAGGAAGAPARAHAAFRVLEVRETGGLLDLLVTF